MAWNHPTAAVSGEKCCYRLTAKGRAHVDAVALEVQNIGSLSRYLHDVLILCGSGIWFDQLRQFMPPRSLRESLGTLLTLGLIERLDEQPADSWRAAVRPTLSVSVRRPMVSQARSSSLRTLQAASGPACSGGEGLRLSTPGWFVR